MALASDSSVLVTGSSDHRFLRERIRAGDPEIGPGAVRIWDFKTHRLQRSLDVSGRQILAVAISADGRQVVCGEATRPGKTSDPNWLAYRPDETFIGSHGIERFLAWRQGDDFTKVADKRSE